MDILIDMNVLVGGGILILILILTSYFGLKFYFTVNKQAPSIIAFRKAYKKNKPVMEVEDGAGNIAHFVGEKNKKWDVEFSKKDFGLKIDPMYSTISPSERLPKGVPLYRYRVNLHFPTDVRGAHGLVTLLHHVRTSSKYDVLDVIKDDMAIIELIDMDSDDLDDAMITKIKEFDPYFNEDTNRVLLAKMVEAIEEIKAELPNLKIKSERISIADALKYIPTAFTSQDLNKVLQMVEFRTRQEHGYETKVLTYAIGAAIVFSGVGLAVYLISNSM